MRRLLLILGSFLLFGCVVPVRLLVHNELPYDARFTVRWTEGEEPQSTTVRIGKGEAEEISLYDRAMPPTIRFEWRSPQGVARGVVAKSIPEKTYHVRIEPQRVTLTPMDGRDEIHHILTMPAGIVNCGVLSVIVVVGIYRVCKSAFKRKA